MVSRVRPGLRKVECAGHPWRARGGRGKTVIWREWIEETGVTRNDSRCQVRIYARDILAFVCIADTGRQLQVCQDVVVGLTENSPRIVILFGVVDVIVKSRKRRIEKLLSVPDFANI